MHSDKKHGFKISVLFVLNVFVITQKSAADVFIHSASLSVFHCQDDILIVISVMLSEEVEPSFVFRSRFISVFTDTKARSMILSRFTITSLIFSPFR